MDDKVYQEAKDLICEVIEVEQEELEDDIRLVEDLGVDSILILELKSEFEKKYSIKIDKENLSELNSLAQITGYLKAQNI
ncbi:MAG: acyl carrier protein [Proteobacteria bacterium]|nr:acyl carrier protein [Pseudomonadota bacterium]